MQRSQNEQSNRTSLSWLLALTLSLFAAQASANLELKSEVFQEVEFVDDNGETQTRLEPAKTVLPGGEVIYVISYRNLGTEPAENVVIDNPVPEQLIYGAGSASGANTEIKFSVGGEAWDVLEALTVLDENDEPRAAVPADVRAIRWIVTTEILAGATGQVSYRAVLK